MLIMSNYLKLVLCLFAFSFIALSCNKDDGNGSINDYEKPVITILGENPYYTPKDAAYVDPGATAHDNVDGDITSNIAVTNNVDVSAVGDYTVNYRVGDVAGNVADTFRVVKVMVFK